jgi:hypothetical protein
MLGGKCPDWYRLPVKLEGAAGGCPDPDPDEVEAATLLPLSLPLLLNPPMFKLVAAKGFLNGLDGLVSIN